MAAVQTPSDVRLFSSESAGAPIERIGFVSCTTVKATNIVRDIRETITNIFGGRMMRYERLLDRATREAEDRFRERLFEIGAHGAVAVRYSHPSIVTGGAELVLYGTAFRYVETKPPAEAPAQTEAPAGRSAPPFGSALGRS